MIPLNSLAIATLLMSAIMVLTIAAMLLMYRYFNKQIIKRDSLLRTMRDDVGALCSGAVGVGEHLTKLEERSRLLMSRQEQLELLEAPDRSYKQAIKMAKRGADVDEVIADCGIARGEAELILLANRLDRDMRSQH